MTADDPRAKLRSQIDENLKLIYDQTLKEEVPDRFLKLLEQLRDQDNRKGTAKK